MASREKERGEGVEKEERKKKEEEGRARKRKSTSPVTKIHSVLYVIVHSILPIYLTLSFIQVLQEILTGPLQLTRISHTDCLIE